MAKNAVSAQTVTAALKEALELSFKLAQALRTAEEAIKADTASDTNGADTRAARSAHTLVTGAIIRDLNVWEGYEAARNRR